MSTIISLFLQTLTLIGFIIFIPSILYSLNVWNRWKKGFGKGNATKKDFKSAVKWSFLAIIGLFLIMVGGTGFNKKTGSNQTTQQNSQR